MGVFGFAEIMTNLELKDQRVDLTDKVGSLYPNKQEFKESWPACVRGTALGSALGILPGGGATLSSFASYTLEKKISKNPERFGKGHPAGLAGPESANNAARSEEHTSELQSLMRSSYAVFCLKKKKK